MCAAGAFCCRGRVATGLAAVAGRQWVPTDVGRPRRVLGGTSIPDWYWFWPRLKVQFPIGIGFLAEREQRTVVDYGNRRSRFIEAAVYSGYCLKPIPIGSWIWGLRENQYQTGVGFGLRGRLSRRPGVRPAEGAVHCWCSGAAAKKTRTANELPRIFWT